MRLRKTLFALVLLLGLLAAPGVGSASPGAVVVNGYPYGTTATIGVYGSTPHSPTMFSANEARYTVHLDHYVYRFKQTSGYGSPVMIALQNIGSGQMPLTPTSLGGGNAASVYLDGDFYLYVWDLTGNPPATSIEIAGIAPGTVRIQSPAASGYLLKGSTHTISAYIEGAATSVTASVTDGTGTTALGTLTASGSLYGMSYTFNQSLQPTAGGAMPVLKVQATYASGPPVVATIPIYVTTHAAGYYQSVDSTWYYNSPYDNSFIGMADPDRMCYEFVVDAASTPEPLQISSDIIAFMQKGVSPYHDYTTRPGTQYATASTTWIPYADAIYFSGFHFAKVTKWDANGNPIELQSKWGPDEAIRSTSANAFAGGIYGSAQIYFRK